MSNYKFFSTEETRTYPRISKSRGRKSYLIVWRNKTENNWYTYISEQCEDIDDAKSDWRSDSKGIGRQVSSYGPGWESKNIDNIHVFEINN